MFNRNQKNTDYENLITEKHILLLLAYMQERSKSQAQRAIADRTQKQLHLGRHVLPLTQDLLEWKLIKRTNEGSPSVKGHKHKTEPEGCREVDKYFEKLKSIAEIRYGY